MKTENFKSLSITLLLVLLSSCRSNDTDNTLNPDSKANTTVKINLLGSDFAGATEPEFTASAGKGSIIASNAVQPQITMIDPSTFISTEVTPVFKALNTQAAMSGTKAAVSGNNLENGMQFRVIAYRSASSTSPGAYVAHRDYRVNGANVELVNPAEGDLWLDNSISYDIVAYSFATASLPNITTEKGNISGAKADYINNTDMMYVKMPNQTFAKGTNTLGIILRHKTALIEKVNVNVLDSQLSFSGSGITNTVLTIPHAKDGSIAFSGANGGVISGRTDYENKFINLTSINGTAKSQSQTLNNVLINTNTSIDNSKMATFAANVTITDNTKTPAVTKTQSINSSFKLLPEYKQNLNVEIKKCGAYTRPKGASQMTLENKIWREFMCNDLGVDTSGNFNPFDVSSSTNIKRFHGARFQWGSNGLGNQQNIRWITKDVDQDTKYNPGLAFNSPGAPAGNPNGAGWRGIGWIAGGLYPWTDTSAGASTLPANSWTTSGNGGVNNPCPSGYRIPTKEEWTDAANAGDGFNKFTRTGNASVDFGDEYGRGRWLGNALFIPFGGYRRITSTKVPSSAQGELAARRTENAFYWTSSRDEGGADLVYFSSITPSGTISSGTTHPTHGMAVRCIKEYN
ncbi:FISUMP domain-containing protein [Elizabethkingia anophelis]|uniref:FISUMP domain-containing protein n=1 Tax=Elizabethkingia anophelis TaxID=1117645 RepID=UPI00131768E6|nr:FISUMP domain-containing protein [Elizabethkingia anophelis]MBE9395471.1 hypothetical protein [Elizabethkingia anophelis]MBE9408269.1 hypothetical protein [Elizabethkingia anophelis]BBQ08853.1 hypothetical protein JUNP353_3424 [Elizabethkingia anophelis]